MAWFEKEFIAFFKELEINNHKEWFQKNKTRYEQFVKEPFSDFVTEMISRIRKDDPSVGILAKEAMFRINRDIRFSNDKTPYKTNVSAVISSAGRKDLSVPGAYFEFSAQGVQYYGGAHHVEKDQLENVRRAIQRDPEKFTSIVKNKKFINTFAEVKGEKYKRLPRELDALAEKVPLIFNKNFYYGAKFDIDILLADNLADEIFSLYKTGKDFNMFFKEAYGMY